MSWNVREARMERARMGRQALPAWGAMMLFAAVGSAAAAPPAIPFESARADTSRKPAKALVEFAGPSSKGLRHVIQLDGAMTPERKRRLAEAGIALGEPLGGDAFVARLDGADRAAVGAIDFIRWHGAFDPAWKKGGDLGRRAHRTDERRAEAARGEASVVVHLFEGATADETRDAIAAIERLPGAAVLKQETVAGAAMITLRAPAARLDDLAALPAVRFIEEAPEFTERNSSVRGVVLSNAPGVEPFYNYGLRGEDQILGILDSAINTNHCSFFDAVNPIGPLHRKVLAYNAAPGSFRHGTHVACTAVGDNGDSSDTRGVAYNAKLVYGPIPSLTEASLSAALNLHHAQGARVHTNSWGNDATTSYDGVCRAIDAFMYANEDDLVLFAVTNSATLKNPENAKNSLAVSASQDSPVQDTFCIGGAGPTADGRRKPDVMSPGCDTTSAYNITACGTISLFGTSHATPAVAGAALLARQYYTEGWYPTGYPSATDAFIPSGALLKATLINSALDMTGIADFPSAQEGWGRVCLNKGLFLPGGPRRILVVSDVRNAQGLTTGGNDQVEVGVNSTQPLKITLAWSDEPAPAGSVLPAINDLDLIVTSPGGTVYKGNVFSGGQSAPGGAKDNKNNVEQVLIPAPEVGIYTINIEAAYVNIGPQGYALIATGKPLPPQCPADVDQNGVVNLADLAIIIMFWNTPGPAGDVDDDGAVGIGDVAMLITHWGMTCP